MNTDLSERRLTVLWATARGLAMLVAAVVQARAFWPGVMMPDAIEEYRQALAGVYDDWHPPAVAWTWHQLLRLAPGPGPMLVFYWGGLALLCGKGGARGVGLCYGLGNLVIGISSDLRYHLWTMMAAILALAIFAREGASRWRRVAAPAALVAVTAALARLQ